MSAIAGLLALDNAPLDGEQLDKMAATLQHRGAYALRWSQPPIGFIKRRTDSPNPDSPGVADPAQVILCAHARVDNRDELLRMLGMPEAHSDPHTDDNLILAAYARWGTRCVDYLVGDFCFALWDARQQLLFCARDHMGIRPFYYVHTPRYFGFASEIRALRALPIVSGVLDEPKIASYLLRQSWNQTSTFFQDIQSLPPAHTLTLSKTGIQLQRYWTLDSEKSLHLSSDAAYSQRFLELFGEAVKCRIDTANPVGVLLSGGLDSSSVAVMAHRSLKDTPAPNLTAFSGLFPTFPSIDESRFIKWILEATSMDFRSVDADALNPLANLETVLWHIEQPHLSPNLFLTWHLFTIARAMGIKVVLDGTDGDAGVSHGLGILLEMAQQGHWGQFFALSVALQEKYPGSGPVTKHMLMRYGYPALVQLARDGRTVAVLRAMHQIRRYFHISYRHLLGNQLWQPLIKQALRRQEVPDSIRQWFNPEFLRRIDLPSRLQAAHAGQTSPERTERHIHINALLQNTTTMILELLDKVGAAFGLEIRHPFFDKRLIEFCVSLPPEQKINADGWTRLILRRAMEGLLPQAIQWRPGKSNLSGNLSHALLTHGRSHIESSIYEHPEPLARYLNIQTLRDVWQRFMQHPSEADAMKLWVAINLQQWLVLNNFVG